MNKNPDNEFLMNSRVPQSEKKAHPKFCEFFLKNPFELTKKRELF
jgi:hypothetical protein